MMTEDGKWITHENAAEKIGIVEETKIEPTFEDGIRKVESYRLALDVVLDGLELMMQPNRLVLETGAITSAPKQNPFELAASGCAKLKQFVDDSLGSRLDIVIDAFNKMGSTERAAQTKGRAVIRRIRRFVTVDNEEMKVDIEKMYQGLEQMDVARHDVKNSKTKEELEEKGMIYHKSVKCFNDQWFFLIPSHFKASKIQMVIDELPTTLFTNQREVVKFFAQREKYHAAAVEILKEAAENLNKK
ncbi:hypothetical protein DICVIV_03026 [Dictyocaulus viviparus]|uniref:BAR domain-containing protein n=1 Tax=Dictyocaulus viviparus TaxID=29172 RepID=A0A0D8Y881_DICVI|nr:hypothetical protein DICVIV_03026 [Dictyocaulus viviparus]